MQCDVTSCIVCIPNNVEYLNMEKLQKCYQKSCTMNLSDLCNAIQKILNNISCHRHFKETRTHFVLLHCIKRAKDVKTLALNFF